MVTLRQYWRLYAVAALIMFASFSVNFFGMGGVAWFSTYQKDSESLVVSKLSCGEILGHDHFAGMLVMPTNQSESNSDFAAQEKYPICIKKNLDVYVSQYGLQGKLAGVSYNLSHRFLGMNLTHFFVVAQLGWALLTALVLAFFVIWVAKEFTVFTAYFTTIMLSLSVWIVGYARNLYWATPLLFLPLVFSLFYYRQLHMNRKYVMFLVGLFALFFLRFLNGYEFTPEVILAPVTVAGYFIYKRSAGFKDLFREGAAICLIGGLAFVGAFSLNFYQVYKYVGNGHEAFQLIKSRAVERTTDEGAYRKYVYSGLNYTLPAVYDTANNYINLDAAARRQPLILTNTLSIINYLLLPVVSFPLAVHEPLGTIIDSFLVYAILAYIVMRQQTGRVAKILGAKFQALRSALVLGLLSSVSWLVLAHAHSLVHAHIDGIIFYLPFMMFVYIALGLWVESALELLWPLWPGRLSTMKR